MIKKICLRLLSLCLLSNVASAATLPNHTDQISHVIYVTFDGVRWQDIFLNDHPHFNTFWKKYADTVTIYGAPNQTSMEVASAAVSLPSYLTQMSGVASPCIDNDCGRTRIQTFPENILFKLNLKKKDVATFASWDSIGLSVEKIPGITFVNEGNIPMTDPESHTPDEVMRELNHQQDMDHPPSSDRYDRYTFAQAMHYFEKYRPKFLWISLDDADTAAHDRDLKSYNRALDFYDSALDTLFTTLQRLALDKNTLVIVTTDHGRGNDDHWTSHGPKYPESKQTWAFVKNGEFVLLKQEGHYDTLSIRPTIEKAVGL